MDKIGRAIASALTFAVSSVTLICSLCYLNLAKASNADGVSILAGALASAAAFVLTLGPLFHSLFGGVEVDDW